MAAGAYTFLDSPFGQLVTIKGVERMVYSQSYVIVYGLPLWFVAIGLFFAG